MYELPLRFIQIGPSVAICASRIVTLMGTDSYQARQSLKRQRKNGTLINGAGRFPVKTALFLDNGSVASSPFSLTVLLNKITKSTSSETGMKNRRTTKNVVKYEMSELVQAPEELEEDSETSQELILNDEPLQQTQSDNE